MRLLALSIGVLFLLPFLLFSGVSFESDTITGTNSEIIELKLIVDELVSVSVLEFDLVVSNPSVCLITEIGPNDHIVMSNITNEKRGHFSISMTVDKETKDLRVLAKLLSGSDSSCTITLENVVINGEPTIGDSVIIHNNFTNSIGPYLRFLYNSAPYPNPLKSGKTSIITIHNDKDISVDLYVHNEKGQLYDHKRIDYKRGENRIEISTDGSAAGTYYISGFSGVGDFFEKIVVYK
jgi:hypothetical protein